MADAQKVCGDGVEATPDISGALSSWGRAGEGGEGLQTKLLFFSLFPLSLPLTTFFHLFFSPFPSIPLPCMIFSRATLAGPVSAAAPEGTLGRKRRRGVSVPVLP